MNLCQSIDALSMAYLDSELAAEERRELELHLLDCATCRAHLDGERADLELVQRALVAPPAPDMLKARIARALDGEDLQATAAERKRWSSYLLPGSAVLAAAAAIAMFVGVRPASTAEVGTVAKEVIRPQTASLPLEVQGASTGPWLRQHFAPVEPPEFTEPGIQLVGARLNTIGGHTAAELRYLVSVDDSRVLLTAVVIPGLHGDELSGGEELHVGKLTLWLHHADGIPTVTYVDSDNVGYAFGSQRLTAQELVQLVVSSDLIGRAQQEIR